MMMPTAVTEIENIVVIGSGNVAWHLLNAFPKAGIPVLQILGRNSTALARLEKEFGVPYITNPQEINRRADLYILAVGDDRIGPVAESLGLHDHFLVHTSGYSGLDVLAGKSAVSGVIWPMQTLTAGRPADYKQIPYFVEASDTSGLDSLMNLVKRLGPAVRPTDTHSRQRLHLAAVIASNFTNHLYHLAARIARESGSSWDDLIPLISETARKAADIGPEKSQTGPASRNDLAVIHRHLEWLASDPELADIYRQVSGHIQKLKTDINHEEL
jgi:predicted short-subunit dehydrogenase-like oxidoreductase (DUF2520 family)